MDIHECYYCHEDFVFDEEEDENVYLGKDIRGIGIFACPKCIQNRNWLYLITDE